MALDDDELRNRICFGECRCNVKPFDSSSHDTNEEKLWAEMSWQSEGEWDNCLWQ